MTNSVEKTNSTVISSEIGFIAKAVIITILITGSISFLMPSKEDFKSLETPETVALLYSFFDNPEVLIMISEHYERKDELEYAIITARLAMGILEKSNGNMTTLQNYKKRRESLESRIRKSKEVEGHKNSAK